MKQYSASTTIQAALQVVWDILTNVEASPDWDPGISHVEGRLAPGETVKFFTKLSSQAFPVKVTFFEPKKRLVLTGACRWGYLNPSALIPRFRARLAPHYSRQRKSSAGCCCPFLAGISPISLKISRPSRPVSSSAPKRQFSNLLFLQGPGDSRGEYGCHF